MSAIWSSEDCQISCYGSQKRWDILKQVPINEKYLFCSEVLKFKKSVGLDAEEVDLGYSSDLEELWVQVQIIASPGQAVFDATIKLNVENKQFVVEVKYIQLYIYTINMASPPCNGNGFIWKVGKVHLIGRNRLGVKVNGSQTGLLSPLPRPVWNWVKPI